MRQPSGRCQAHHLSRESLKDIPTKETPPGGGPFQGKVKPWKSLSSQTWVPPSERSSCWAALPQGHC
ncbi:hypothetical protein Cadr_000000381 [Camelus dromedarius]|uniref:Uncharacterized protein n=1 Tax=Camelus dromedarius TaxID=9838 RepID=A0A5N4ELG3_CAMDR|nr:hypothetical protein Cadr_000000381 [Camelus dromedarius]